MNKKIQLALVLIFSILVVGSGAQPKIVKATTPALNYIYPDKGVIGSAFSISNSDYGDLGDELWFSNGSYSTFLQFTSQDENGVMHFTVPSSVCPGTQTETCSSNFSTSTPNGTYSIYMLSAASHNGDLQRTDFGTFTVVNSNSAAHPDGTNVLGPDGTVYRIMNSVRNPYTSAGAFLSYKFNSWANTLPANAADMDLPLARYFDGNHYYTAFVYPRGGSLINDHGTVYLITGGGVIGNDPETIYKGLGRAGFTTDAVFRGLSYSYSNVYKGDTSFIGLNYEPINSVKLKHGDGVLINDNGTLYVMRNGNRMGFPSMAVLDSWGYWASEAVPANSYDRAAPISGVVQARMVNQLSI